MIVDDENAGAHMVINGCTNGEFALGNLTCQRRESMRPAAFTPLVGGMALFAGLALAASAGRSPQPEELAPPVQLPAFTVRDSRVLPPRESWRYAAAPGLEVLSTASAAETSRQFQDFLEFHRAVNAIWPLLQMNAAMPACLILCSRTKEFAPFVPARDQALARDMVSVSYQDRELSSIVIELDSQAEPPSTDGTVPDLSQYTADLVHREYVHFLLLRIGDRVPPWLEQGLWQVFLGLKTSGGMIGLPGLSLPDEVPVRKKGAPQDLAAAIRAGSFFSLPGLFGSAQEAGEHDRSPWARESYEFVHFCLLGAEGKHRGAFLQFAQLASRVPADEELFRRCFGLGYADFLTRLWRYTGWSEDLGLELTSKATGKALPLPSPRVRTATDGEVGRIKGEALRMAGRAEEAHFALIAPFQRGSRDPQLLAALGLQEAEARRPERALPFLEAAAADHTTRARAWAALAQLRLDSALERPDGTNGTLSAAQMKSVLEPLFAARTLAPPLPEVYRTAAAAWARSQMTPLPGHLAFIDQGVALFPSDADLVWADADLQRRFGYRARAEEICALGLRFTVAPADRARIAALQRGLSAPAGVRP
jgi:hypothetical protein